MLNVDRTRPTTVADLSMAQKSNSTVGSVLPGQEFVFYVNMRAPAREGKHISYWRLKAADGTPFGHKLWCDIEVKGIKPFTSSFESLKPTSSSQQPQNAAVNTIESLKDVILKQQENLEKTMQKHNELAQKNCAKAVEAVEEGCNSQQAERARQLRKSLACGFDAREEITRLEASRLQEKLAGYVAKVEAISRETQAKAEQLLSKQATVEDEEPETEVESSLKDSQMIMPTLERDGTPSASNSIHRDNVSDAAESVAVQTAPESVAATETKTETDSTVDEAVDDLDDVEFESADGGSEMDDEDDDGFLTDEEYDILDASDEEGRPL